MLYTAQTVRDNVRSRDGRRVFYLAQGDTLTPEARDVLTAERIELLPAAKAKPERYGLLSGGYIGEKPEHMTHLTAEELVPKTHSRIRFRGALDTLEAVLLLCQAQLEPVRAQLGELLALARKIMRCDVLGEPLGEPLLCGMTPQQLRERSHRPQEYYGTAHFMPEASHGSQVLLLNLARCVCRSAELAAAEAFSDREGLPTRTDLLTALNRMSSMLYILMLMSKRSTGKE